MLFDHVDSVLIVDIEISAKFCWYFWSRPFALASPTTGMNLLTPITSLKLNLILKLIEDSKFI